MPPALRLLAYVAPLIGLVALLLGSVNAVVWKVESGALEIGEGA